MRVLYGVLLVALLSACATSTGGGGTGGKDQVAAATAAWRAAYDSRDPARPLESAGQSPRHSRCAAARLSWRTLTSTKRKLLPRTYAKGAGALPRGGST